MKTKMNLCQLAALVLPLFFAGCTETTQPTGNLAHEYMVFRAAQDTLHFVDNCDTCGACDNSNRWTDVTEGGGKEIDPADARKFVQDFSESHSDLPRGAFLSKVALDSIFCHHSNYNGIYCYLGKDDKGNTTMIFEGWHEVDTVTNKSRVTVQFNSALAEIDRYRTFITQTMCPTVCGYCGY